MLPADQRILRGTPATLEFFAVDQDGSGTTLTGPVTIGVTRGDGSTVLAAGSGTTDDPDVPGRYTAQLTAGETSLLDLLTATWHDAASGANYTTTADVVGGFFVSLAELRKLPNLNDDTKVSDDDLLRARKWFEDEFERYTRRAFVPRYGRVALVGTGRTTVLLPDVDIRTVRSVRAYTSPTESSLFSAADLADLAWGADGVVRRQLNGRFAVGGGVSYVFEYEFGLDRAPQEVREAAFIAIRDKAVSDYAGQRQYSIQTEQGVARFSMPGNKTPFGIQFVDEKANAWRLIGAA